MSRRKVQEQWFGVERKKVEKVEKKMGGKERKEGRKIEKRECFP